MENKQDRKDRRSEEHIEKILRFYECIKHDSRPHKGEILSQDFHREREREGDTYTSNFRTQGSKLGSVASAGDAALFSEKEREREIREREKERETARKVTSDCRLQVSI